MHISDYVLHRHPLQPDRRAGTLAWASVFALLATGCQWAPARSPSSEAPSAPASIAVGASEPAVENGVEDHLDYARSLSTQSPELRGKRHQQALTEYRQHPETYYKIRLAIAASFLEPLPDAMEQTRARFKELLQPSLAKPPGVAALLEIRLNELERHLAMQAQAEQLQQELDAAQAKIQALTTIEQTLETPGKSKGAR